MAVVPPGLILSRVSPEDRFSAQISPTSPLIGSSPCFISNLTWPVATLTIQPSESASIEEIILGACVSSHPDLGEPSQIHLSPKVASNRNQVWLPSVSSHFFALSMCWFDPKPPPTFPSPRYQNSSCRGHERSFIALSLHMPRSDLNYRWIGFIFLKLHISFNGRKFCSKNVLGSILVFFDTHLITRAMVVLIIILADPMLLLKRYVATIGRLLLLVVSLFCKT